VTFPQDPRRFFILLQNIIENKALYVMRIEISLTIDTITVEAD